MGFHPAPFLPETVPQPPKSSDPLPRLCCREKQHEGVDERKEPAPRGIPMGFSGFPEILLFLHFSKRRRSTAVWSMGRGDWLPEFKS